MDNIISRCIFDLSNKQKQPIMATSRKYYSRLTTSDFKAIHLGCGTWLITYTYPAGRKISAILHANCYDIITDIDATQRKLKWVKDVIKHKNLTQVN